MTRKLSFVLVATDQSPMIMSRLDYHAHVPNNPKEIYGLGYKIFETGSFDPQEINMIKEILDHKRKVINREIVFVDCGANIGVHTVNIAKHMSGWGYVYSFEPQTRIFYALAGNVALNNCHNAYVFNVIVSNEVGEMPVPSLDYNCPSSFGSVELIPNSKTENIGQYIDYEHSYVLPTINIDSLSMRQSIDFIKMDIEGMELLGLNGASYTISEYSPILLIENCKCSHEALVTWFSKYEYSLFKLGENTLCIQKDDDIFHTGLVDKYNNMKWIGI